jgi:hypothetical protein
MYVNNNNFIQDISMYVITYSLHIEINYFLLTN